MATKKEHKFVEAETNKSVSKSKIKEAKPVGNAKPKRILAVVFWLIAIIFEIVAVLVLFGKINITAIPTLYALIGALVLDLVFLVIGSQFWKKANHIDPVSEANKTKFWLWNNMGLIVGCFAFIPLIVLLLTNKDLDKKTKTIATIAAVIALLIGGVSSYDFNPVSSEQKDIAMQTLGSTKVYWAPFGKVYHTHEDCGYLNQTDTLTFGTVEQAIAEGRTKLCSYCAKKDGITAVATD